MSKLTTRAFDMAGQENCDSAEYDMIQELAERLKKVERGLYLAFKHLEEQKSNSGMPTPLWKLHDEYLDGDLK